MRESRLLKALFLLILTVLFGSCDGRKEEYSVFSEVYNFSQARNVSINEIFDSVEVIPLLFEGEIYPKSVSRFKKYDDFYFVFDEMRRIHVFTPEGHYVSCSDEKFGNGPEEFPHITGFGWNPYSRLIEILSLDKIRFYDEKFNFVKEVELPLKDDTWRNCTDIYDISANEHLLRPTGSERDPYAIHVFDSERGIITHELTYIDDVVSEGSMQYRNFYPTDSGKLMFAPTALTNKIYDFDKEKKKLSASVYLSPGKNELTKEEAKSHQGEKSKNNQTYIITCNRDIPIRTLLNSDRVFTTVKRGSTIRTFYTVVMDRNDGSMKRVDLYKGDNQVFPFLDEIDGKYAYAIMLREKIAEFPGLLFDKAEDAEQILEKIEEDTYIVLKYKIKD